MMKMKAVVMAIALLFGFAGSMGGVAAPAAEAQRYERGPGADRGYRRPPPRRFRPAPRRYGRNRGYRAPRYGNRQGYRYGNRHGYRHRGRR